MVGKRRHFSQWSQVAGETPSSAAACLIGISCRSRQERRRADNNMPAQGKFSDADDSSMAVAAFICVPAPRANNRPRAREVWP